MIDWTYSLNGGDNKLYRIFLFVWGYVVKMVGGWKWLRFRL